MRIRRIPTGAYISSSPCFASSRDGTILAWGGDGLHLTDLEGNPRPGWPRPGLRFFASSPSVMDAPGRSLLFCGNDDDRLYGWNLDGSDLPGFPVQTGGDVYSAPALADLDGDGAVWILFGSDDGGVHLVDSQGRPRPGWPRWTGHFVAASPCLVDLDGCGRPEVVAGSWDGRLYAWRADGSPLPGWPVELGSYLWSSPVAADLDGCGRPEILVAADRLYVLRHDGTHQPGFPVRTGGWMVSTPCLADLDGDGDLSIAVGAEALHVFRSDGSPRPGSPVDLGGYIWASPLAVDVDGCGRPEWIVGSWAGTIETIRGDGGRLREHRIETRGPIYSSPAFHWERGRSYLACGSWDRGMYLADWAQPERPASPMAMFRGGPCRTGQLEILRGRRPMKPPATPAGHAADLPPRPGRHELSPLPPRPEEILYLDLELEDPRAVRLGRIVYRVAGTVHPSPLVPHQGRLRGMIHPQRPGRTVEWHLELTGWDGSELRLPELGEHRLKIPG